MRCIAALGLALALSSIAACDRARPVPGSGEAEQGATSVAFVIVDGVYNTELTAPLDVFHHTVFHTQPGMKVFTVAPSHEAITTFEGLRILPDYDFSDAPSIDVLVIPSSEHSMDRDLENAALMRFVRERGQAARYLMSLCDGAFVLAAAGLLDGLESTTFPGDIEAYKKRFPELVVHEGVSFVHDGKAITSSGGALSFDPAMYLCERLFGLEAARGIGRGLCIDWDLAQIASVRPGAEQ